MALAGVEPQPAHRNPVVALSAVAGFVVATYEQNLSRGGVN
jgi:hypothetical protein